MYRVGSLISINSNGISYMSICISNNCELVVKMSANDEQWDDVLKCGYRIHDFYTSFSHSSGYCWFVLFFFSSFLLLLYRMQLCWHWWNWMSRSLCAHTIYSSSTSIVRDFIVTLKCKRCPNKKIFCFWQTWRNAKRRKMNTVLIVANILRWKHLLEIKDFLYAEYAFS